MTKNDLSDKMVKDIAAAGFTAAWNIANFVLDECGLTHAGADLQQFGNFGDKAGPLFALNFGSVSSKLSANARVATTLSHRLFNNNADQINTKGRQFNPWTNKLVTIAKETVSEDAVACAIKKANMRSQV